MDRREYDILYKAEDSHWWFAGMAWIMQSLMRTYYRPGDGLRILDAGCGTGGTMAWLAEFGTVTGCDMSPHALRFSRMRGHKQLAMASVMAAPFEDETFDVVLSLDVLYFDGVDDEVALQEFARVLAPGGRVIVRVPAFDRLRGVHDIKVSTGHRYTVDELTTKMKRGTFCLELVSYANSILFPFVALKRMCERWLPLQSDSDLCIDVKGLGKLFTWCLILESRLLRRGPLPFGLSVIGVGRKPLRRMHPVAS